MDAYRAFLEQKIKLAEFSGFDVAREDLNDWLKPHAAVAVQWALKGGRRALFEAFGLHKTSQQIEILTAVQRRTGRPTLNVIPLGVRGEFLDDAKQMGRRLKFIRDADEIDPDVDVHLTNYETIRERKLDPNLFAGASLDEASVLRSYGSKTYQEFMPLFAEVPYRFVATATPSPNRYKELIHYAGFLGVMDTGQALTRFFQRDSENAGNLTLYPHKEQEFWFWVHSWALFVQKPSDLGFSDDGYVMPPLDVRFHEVQSNHAGATVERDGQGMLFSDPAKGVTEAAREKRDSMPARIAKMAEIVAHDPDEHFLLWHNLEDERRLIETTIPDVVSIFGTLDLDKREVRLADFKNGVTRRFATKPELSGSGSNFQKHCHRAIFAGIDYDFNDFIQAVHRILRFGQKQACRIDIIHSEAEREVLRGLMDKWARDTEMRAKMAEIIQRYGLSHKDMELGLKRTIGVTRQEVRGERYVIANNDCVAEARLQPHNAVDLIVTSIPFANHYEYTPLFDDFGHTDNNEHFWKQMDFLTPELLRILKPGRLACIHVKDRVLFGNVTGAGLPTISPFHAEAIMHYRRHGFDYCGMVHINTDVVRENNQTYRLGYTEMCKDGSKTGVGCPEYVLLFHKPQSDRLRSYADTPIVKSKEAYSLARWQIDAHAFWRSSGDRLLTPEELASYGPQKLATLFTNYTSDHVYDHEWHVRIGEALQAKQALPSSFMSLAPAGVDENTWHDVNRMQTLNGKQSQRNVEQHVCPLQFDIVDRLIRRFSMENELVYDPFGGLGTVPYRAVLMGRLGQSSELSPSYFKDSAFYLEQAERQRLAPSLFDLDQPLEAAE
ncbi:MAG TPA: DNA methyltransferase [Rhizomicrobium sp.]|jgi:DNA modification methylase|nr:DNA methyltransferase [Rhizomicrobium sp.]